MVHRVDPDRAGVWGRWNDGDKERIYGFEPVKAFWFTGVKEHGQAGEHTLIWYSLRHLLPYIIGHSGRVTEAQSCHLVNPVIPSVSTFTAAATCAVQQPRPI